MATVLVVDDAAFMRTMLTDILVAHGHRVIGEGANGAEAVHLYATLKPDIVTLDVVMPTMDGVTALKEILASDPKARVLMVSSVSQAEITRDALKIGASGFVVKPFQPDHVKDVVDQVLIR